MSYIVFGLALTVAAGVWLFASHRDREAQSRKQKNILADKRKIFREHAAVADIAAPLGGLRRKRGFGLRG